MQQNTRRALVAVAVWVSGAWTPWVLAQAPSQEPHRIEGAATSKSGAHAARAIPLEEVPDRAETTSAELDALLRGEASRRTLERIGGELDGRLRKIESRLATTREVLAARPSLRTLRELNAVLGGMLEGVRTWDQELDHELVRLRTALQRLDGIAATWEATAEAAQREGAAATTVARIAAVRGEIDKARAAVDRWRNQILTVRDRLVDPGSALVVNLDRVQSAIDARLEGVFRANGLPLWSPQVRESLREEWKGSARQHLLQQLQEGAQYTLAQRSTLGFQLVLFVVLALSLRLFRERARARAEDDFDLRQAKEVFEHPWAMGLLIALILTTPIHPLAPRSASLVAATLAILATAWLARRLFVPALACLPWAIMGLFLFDRALDLLESLPTLERVGFLMEMVGGLGFLMWLLRPSRFAEVRSQLQLSSSLPLGSVMRVEAVVLALAIVVDAAGWDDLATILGRGALVAAVAGLLVYVMLRVLQSLATFALVLWPLRLVRAISQHRLLVRRRLERLLRVVAVGAWATLVTGQLALLGPVTVGVGRILDAGVSVGALSVSVGDVLAFALTVWLSFLLARFLVFVLQEDVFTRVRTRRGVPYAISGLVRYTLIVLGFLAGLSAAGVELTKLSIIAGGLGVGIGFGLQNVVNNFVSGLFLLFERPIQVGDTVQVSDVWGELKHIGIRASVVRTLDGAEVIVPNGMLISDKVTNWTLSDSHRRLDVDVGVDYGTPAQRVIDLLLEVAKANPKVLSDPEPRAYFLNFGDSALEFKLRVWLGNFYDEYPTRSALAVAIQEALARAGIGVPFPQRDLHLVSISPDAASGLSAVAQPSRRPIPTPGSGDGS